MSEDNEVANHQPEVCRIPGSVLCTRLGLKHVQSPERFFFEFWLALDQMGKNKN